MHLLVQVLFFFLFLGYVFTILKSLHAKSHKARLSMSLEVKSQEFTFSGDVGAGLGAGAWSWSIGLELGLVKRA